MRNKKINSTKIQLISYNCTWMMNFVSVYARRMYNVYTIHTYGSTAHWTLGTNKFSFGVVYILLLSRRKWLFDGMRWRMGLFFSSGTVAMTDEIGFLFFCMFIICLRSIFNFFFACGLLVFAARIVLNCTQRWLSIVLEQHFFLFWEVANYCWMY